MNLDGYDEVPCGLDISRSSLKNKKLVLIRHPKDVDVGALLADKTFRVPEKGEASNALLSSAECDNGINFKVVVDEDSIQDTFRAVIKGGELAPAFDSSISIVKTVDCGNVDKEKQDNTPAITAYFKVPQEKNLRPCILPLGSSISQIEYDERILQRKGDSLSDMTPMKDKKKKRKSMGADEVPSSTKRKKDKKSKKS